MALPIVGCLFLVDVALGNCCKNISAIECFCRWYSIKNWCKFLSFNCRDGHDDVTLYHDLFEMMLER